MQVSVERGKGLRNKMTDFQEVHKGSRNVSEDDQSQSSESSSGSTDNGSGKYKRRRRVYERMKLKASARYQSLATVPEDQELRDPNTWLGPKIAGMLVACLIFLAGVKEIWVQIVHGNQSAILKSQDVARKKKKVIFPTEDYVAEDEVEAYKLLRKAKIPKELRYLSGIYEPLLPTDRVFLWQIPRSASSTIKSIAAQCFGLLLATEMGANAVTDQINIFTDLEGGNYVNVDTSTPSGIDHAKQLNVTDMPGLNMVASSYFFHAAETLFSNQHKGRCIVMMRHPVERAASLFAVMSKDHSSSPELHGTSIDDYANSDQVERNWMTRFLSNAQDDDLTVRHLALAKKVMETRCIVGLLKYKGTSLARIEHYFGWTMDSEKSRECHTKLLDWNWPSKNKHSQVQEGSETWRKLASLNNLDMSLYKHAEKVFNLQGDSLFRNLE
jgi:hypothetical protein